MPEFAADIIASLAWSIGRWWLLANSDRSLAFQLRIIRRLLFALSGNEGLKNILTELIEIFTDGGKQAATARKLFRLADRGYSLAVVKSALRRE
jgi:hypothetical protein